MVRYHRCPGYRWGSTLARATARFFDQGRLVEEFIALQREFLVPVTAVQSEGECCPLPALAPRRVRASFAGPGQKARFHYVRDYFRHASAMVLPGEVIVPASPKASAQTSGMLGARQGKIADRDHPL